MREVLLLFLMIGFAFMMPFSARAKSLYFSGLEWKVRDGFGAPGNNHWSGENAWLDEEGNLHLKIRKEGDSWSCAELQSAEKFLYGKFSFEIIGRIDQLDKNIVFGIFNYPQEENRDGFDEIDIEFSRWGKDENNPGNYTVYGDDKAFAEKSYNFDFALSGSHTTHSFTRSPESILFQSFHGHDSQSLIHEWIHYSGNISKKPMPVYLNFWLFKGMAPSDGEEAEIIIKSVKFEGN